MLITELFSRHRNWFAIEYCYCTFSRFHCLLNGSLSLSLSLKILSMKRDFLSQSYWCYSLSILWFTSYSFQLILLFYYLYLFWKRKTVLLTLANIIIARVSILFLLTQVLFFRNPVSVMYCKIFCFPVADVTLWVLHTCCKSIRFFTGNRLCSERYSSQNGY